MTKLSAIVREKVGSRPARILRLQGRIPATLQGEGKEHINLSLDSAEFLTARRHHEHLFDIEFGGGSTETAMVRELQWDALGESIAHVELRRVVRGQMTEAEVELEFTGHPKGGILNHILTHIAVRALPSRIPDKIEVAVDGLSPGHPLLIGDMAMPEGVEAVLPAETAVAVVNVPRGEEEEVGEGEEGEGLPGTDAPSEDQG